MKQCHTDFFLCKDTKLVPQLYRLFDNETSGHYIVQNSLRLISWFHANDDSVHNLPSLYMTYYDKLKVHLLNYHTLGKFDKFDNTGLNHQSKTVQY